MRNLIIFLVLLLFSLSAVSQIKYKYHHLTVDDGLSGNSIEKIYRDSKGFLWIGASSLNRFDGYEVRIYDETPNDSLSYCGSRVTDIMEDSRSNLWIATNRGLNRYVRNKDHFICYREYFNGNEMMPVSPLQQIVEDVDSNIIVRADDNLYKYVYNENYLKIYNFPRQEEMKGYPFSYIFMDREKDFWIASADKLDFYKMDMKKNKIEIFSFFHPDLSGLENPTFNNIIENHTSGKIYLSIYNGGIVGYDKLSKSFRFIGVSPDGTGLLENSVKDLYADETGKIFIGLENGGGLNILDEQSMTMNYVLNDINYDKSLSSNIITDIYKDSHNMMWIGTLYGGVNIYDQNLKKVRHFKQEGYDPASLSNNIVNCFLEDRDGNVWIGTDKGGLNLFNRQNNEFLHFTAQTENSGALTSNAVLSMAEDQDGHIWIGTWNGGLNKYNKESGEFEYFKHNPADINSLGNNNVWALTVDQYNRLWIGFHWNEKYAFDIYDPLAERFTHFGHQESNDNSPLINQVNTFYYDSRGNMWIGTDGSGLSVYNEMENSFTHYQPKDHIRHGLINGVITDIFEDRMNRIWIASEGDGIFLYDPDEKYFKRFGDQHAFADENIVSVTSDWNGNLWMGTKRGIIRFNPDSLETFNLKKEDGLQSNEFNNDAVLRASTGELFFGGINGFNVFYPDSIRKNYNIPPVYITKFNLFGKEVTWKDNNSPLKKNIIETDTIVLSHKESTFSFEFVALNFTNPQSNQYVYKLENFDEDWNPVTRNRIASYTSIDPGDYIFKVKASNNDGIWNNKARSVYIIITPPFWQRWWFYILVGMVFISMIYVTIRYREHNLQKNNRLLQEKINEGLKEVEKQKKEALEKDKQLKEREIAQYEQTWHNNGLIKFNKILRTYRDNIKFLGKHVVSNLVKYIDADQGGFILLNDDDPENKYLELTSSFAYDKKKLKKKKILLDEGQIGACFNDKETIYLEDLPADYTEISSGLGKSAPKYLLIVPLKLDEEVLGVIEIASFKPIEEFKIRFIEILAENIAAIIVTIRAEMKAEVLYNRAQEQTEEIKAQEKEMLFSLEELQKAQKQVAEKEKEMERLSKEYQEKEKKYKDEIDGLNEKISTENTDVGDQTKEKEGKKVKKSKKGKK